MRRDPQQTRPARRAASLAVLGAGAALVLTGCGADGSDAAAWDQARTQLTEASSVRMTTDLSSDSGGASGLAAPDGTVISGPRDGSTFAYEQLFEDANRTQRKEMVAADGQAYSRYTLTDPGSSAGEDAPAYAQKWTSLGEVDPSVMGVGAVVDSLLASLPGEGALAGVEADASPIRRSGQDAVRYVLDEPLEGQDGMRLRAFTVAEDDGELLTLETVTSGTDATMTFTEWDAVDPIEAPAEDEIATQG